MDPASVSHSAPSPFMDDIYPLPSFYLSKEEKEMVLFHLEEIHGTTVGDLFIAFVMTIFLKNPPIDFKLVGLDKMLKLSIEELSLWRLMFNDKQKELDLDQALEKRDSILFGVQGMVRKEWAKDQAKWQEQMHDLPLGDRTCERMILRQQGLEGEIVSCGLVTSLLMPTDRFEIIKNFIDVDGDSQTGLCLGLIYSLLVKLDEFGEAPLYSDEEVSAILHMTPLKLKPYREHLFELVKKENDENIMYPGEVDPQLDELIHDVLYQVFEEFNQASNHPDAVQTLLISQGFGRYLKEHPHLKEYQID